MTREMLRRRVIAVVAALVLLAGIALVLKLEWLPGVDRDDQEDWFSYGETVFPLVIAVLATLLASWFQQRATFIESLRRLWSHLIEAKTGIMDFLSHDDRSADAYLRAYRPLSIAIDEMRGVYRNVGESTSSIGLYPFEPLHDMRRALEALQAQPYDRGSSNAARAEVQRAWDALRFRFLDEFAPPEPTAPIVERGFRDRRRAADRPPDAPG